MRKTMAGNELSVVNPDAAGIDIADTEIQVCVPEDRDGDNNRRFGSFTCDLDLIVEWLLACRIKTVAMEATGIYFIPLLLKLQDAGIEVVLANARDVKNIVGRKTDHADAEWLMTLHRLGLIKSSYQPGNQARQIRTVMRHRESLIQDAARQTQHMQKSMEQMNIKLSTVLSDINGKSGRAIIDAILKGERDPQQLASLADPRCKAGKDVIAASLEGTWNEEHLFTLQQSLDMYDFLQEKIGECDVELEKLLQAYTATIDSFDVSTIKQEQEKGKRKKKASKNAPKINIEKYAYSLWGVNVFEIPGLAESSVLGLIAELGHDFTDKFPTSSQFCSWCNLVPVNKISGGKLLSSRITKRKNVVGQIFRNAAMSVANDKGEMGIFYRRIRSRHGGLQANVATAHKIAKIFYSMVLSKKAYDSSKVGLTDKEALKRNIHRLQNRLNKLQEQYINAC